MVGVRLALQDGHPGVVVVEDFALGGQEQEKEVGGDDPMADGFDEVPLGRVGQGHSESLLESFQAMKGHSAAVLQEGDDAACAFVVSLVSDFGWKLRLEQLAA